MASKIIGCGGYLPEKVITNLDLEAKLDTSDEWIRSRTGITKRHIAAIGENVSDMAYHAAVSAIGDAKIDKSEIDLVIVCTNTHESAFPSAANRLQSMLGLGHIPSFDLQAICSGFLYGMHVAHSLLYSNSYETILLVCSEKMSSLLDWNDRKTCILFGDGAGAVILRRDKSDNIGILDSAIFSDGSLYDILYEHSGVITMNGSEVFKKAVERMSESVLSLLAKNNLSPQDIDQFIPHQANLRIIDSIATRFAIDDKKVIRTIKEHANCSAASIPLAIDHSKKKQLFKDGDLSVFTSFGAGATWGAMLYRW